MGERDREPGTARVVQSWVRRITVGVTSSYRKTSKTLPTYNT